MINNSKDLLVCIITIVIAIFICVCLLLYRLNQDKRKRKVALSNDEQECFLDKAIKCEIEKFGLENSHRKATKIQVEYGHISRDETGKKPLITYSDDCLLHIFRLMCNNSIVAANTDADDVFIGGSYMIEKQYRDKTFSQETSVMCVISGLYTSLKYFAAKDENTGKLHIDKGRLKYTEDVLGQHILVSINLQPAINPSIYFKYYRNREGFTSFIEYVAYKISNKLEYFTYESANKITIYTIATNKTDLEHLKIDTESRISEMLSNAKSNRYNSIVVTIPDSKKNKTSKYLDQVELGTISAIEKHGRGFDEIVIVGHRSEPILSF